MRLSRLTPTNKFEIFNPRWRDRVALMADYKIATHNHIVFPNANSLKGDWYVSGVTAKSYPIHKMKTRNGSFIELREVPLTAIEPLERV